MAMDGILSGAVDDDLGGDGMHCLKHTYRFNNASNSGICALCLQEKLGNLVSSSNSSSFFDGNGNGNGGSEPSASLSLTLSVRPAASLSSSTNGRHRENQMNTTRRSRIPFLLPYRNKKVMADHHPSKFNLVLKRSNSAVAPRRHPEPYAGSGCQKRGGFWSFLHHSKHKPDKASPCTSSSIRHLGHSAQPPPAVPKKPQRAEYVVVVDDSVDSPNTTSSLGRRVSRSRSVGCGNRSFSGDFLERISTGFGDCTLRRVESHREGKRYSSGDAIKEKVRCAGIFGGFTMTSSSSYWVSAGEEHRTNGKELTVVHGRSRSWGWALPSPMRALTPNRLRLKPRGSKSSATPNLAATPSLLSAR